MTNASSLETCPDVPLRRAQVRRDALKTSVVALPARFGVVLAFGTALGFAFATNVFAGGADGTAARGEGPGSKASQTARAEPQTERRIPEKDQNAWEAQTVVHGAEAEDSDGPWKSADGGAQRVQWLDGFQRQASHLGMGHTALKRAGKGTPDSAAYRFGMQKFVRTVATQDGQIARLRSSVASARPDPILDWDASVEEAADGPGHVVSTDEIVVIGLSAADLETASAHGFVVRGPTEVGDSGTTFQRLKAPAGLTREQAERRLYTILPSLSLMTNYKYSIFMDVPGERGNPVSALPGADRLKPSPASRMPCPGPTCFGGELIKWNKKLGACAKNVRIGVIDTSFDIAHPSFKTLKAIQKDFLGGQEPSPHDWHGTAILSLLAGDPNGGTPGLVPDAEFLLATAFQTDAEGNASTDSVRLLAALAWLEELDVDIVNMSFSGPRDPAFASAVERMSQMGVVFVAAAGNMGPTAKPSYPAAYPHVIAVTAVNRSGENYRSANRGKYIDVSAPGVDILTALPGAQQGYNTGTSFAVPFVTAILATRGRSIAFLETTEQEILAGIATHDLGSPGRDATYGVGLVRAPERCPRDDLIARSAPSMLMQAGAGGSGR